VPLLPSLKKLLNDSDVMAQIEECPTRMCNDGIMEDFDGQLFKQHPLFSQDPHALQIIAYYDEVKLCNPLGTHVKQHKLGIVFYTLYTSKVQVISASYQFILCSSTCD